MRARAKLLPAVLLTVGLLAVLAPLAPASVGAPAKKAVPLALHVIPFPNTPDASPEAQIIFSALKPSDLRKVAVTGSSTGSHTGHIGLLPDHAGTAFLPDHGFRPGERVTVHAHLTSGRAGTASGDPGATTLNFSFSVGVAASAASSAADTASASAASQPSKLSFHSRPDLHPPAVSSTRDPDRRSGDIFLTAQATIRGRAQFGTMILDPQGRLVWFRRITRGTPYNLQVQRYQGRRVLTWWQGGFLGRGRDVIVNQSYRTVAELRGVEGYYPDLHELQITPQGTALIDSYSVVHADLTSVGGPSKGRVTDCLIQEFDIRSGRLLWEWQALGHVPLTAAYVGRGTSSAPYDFFHLNSIEQLPGGDLLISSKDTWALYRISHTTGQIIWKLGGKHSDFRIGKGANFEWQHDARLSGHTLTLFNDAAWPQEESQSSAKVLKINQKRHTVVLAQRYTHSPGLLAAIGGSTEILPNGNVFVGWGSAPYFSEYTPGGRQVFAGSFPYSSNSYRALRYPWFGHPATPPSVAAARASKGVVNVYASWNGATNVAGWRVLAGPSPAKLGRIGRWARTGFETSMSVHTHARYLAVQALGYHGQVLARSQTMTR